MGHHRHIRAAAHRNQLKAGKLHHRYIVRADLPDVGQERTADISAREPFSRAASILAKMVVVVVLPSLPVTP
ncbi:MAG: hypothetical protein ACLSB9_28915 [Hydrogeniiclostridium mannosilyticum]